MGYYIAGGNINCYSLLQSKLATPANLNLRRLSELVVPLGDPLEQLVHVHQKTFSRIFIAALYITARTGKRFKYPSTGECINEFSIQLQLIYTMKYHTAVKINGPQPHATTGRSFPNIILTGEENKFPYTVRFPFMSSPKPCETK